MCSQFHGQKMSFVVVKCVVMWYGFLLESLDFAHQNSSYNGKCESLSWFFLMNQTYTACTVTVLCCKGHGN